MRGGAAYDSGWDKNHPWAIPAADERTDHLFPNGRVTTMSAPAIRERFCHTARPFAGLSISSPYPRESSRA
ncbi:hypothetical protein [Streptomyces albipurpureus]|uniref:Uncharacterized protein n=1 Tax=Streptomyces albipurpureus TaxID=2897419 RepID=A0ABT0UIH3_9ACTN|nr:hypothetical protein [Streptomyces sp. CWNU-1]MCM2387248.1 hypothetical protein [Streptomyces sp. CWNU-1]